MPLETPIPIPRPESSSEQRRLWIGNLDLRITEFQLLKILQEYGEIEKFDLLFNKNGPFAGQQRGFGFVTYKLLEDAERLKYKLNGKKLGSKYISVRWAHNLDESDITKPKVETIIPALGVKKEKKVSPEMQIRAIEMKLKMMEHCGSEEFKIDVPSTSSLPCNQPTFNKPQSSDVNTKRLRNKPYFVKK